MTADLLVRGSVLNTRCKDAAFVAAWEIQGHLSTMALAALVGFAPTATVTVVMLAWALVATLVYHQARLDGRPDLLEEATWHRGSRVLHVKVIGTGWAVIKAWLGGFWAFIFSRTLGRTLQGGGLSSGQRFATAAVLALGLTLFGIPSSHHLLKRAGFEHQKLLILGFLAAFLHVSYRVLAVTLLARLTFGLEPPLV